MGHALVVRGLAGSRGRRSPDHARALLRGAVPGRAARLRRRLHAPVEPGRDRDAGLPTTTLVDNARDDMLHRWTPPGGGQMGALTHVVIHGLDITVPLGVPRRSPDQTLVPSWRASLAGARTPTSASISTDSASARPTSTGALEQGRQSPVPPRTSPFSCAVATFRRAGSTGTGRNPEVTIGSRAASDVSSDRRRVTPAGWVAEASLVSPRQKLANGSVAAVRLGFTPLTCLVWWAQQDSNL